MSFVVKYTQVEQSLLDIIVPFLKANPTKSFTQEELIEQLPIAKLIHALKEERHDKKKDSDVFHIFLNKLVFDKENKIKREGLVPFLYSPI